MTRKVVNFGCEGRSQGKFWWRFAEVLTCKSLFRRDQRGERLIELPGSWFPPKFPSGKRWKKADCVAGKEND